MTAIEPLRTPTPALAPSTVTKDDSTSSNVSACGGNTSVKDTPEKLGPVARVCKMFFRLEIPAGSPSDTPRPNATVAYLRTSLVDSFRTWKKFAPNVPPAVKGPIDGPTVKVAPPGAATAH